MKKMIFLFLGVLFINGCGYREGVVQKAELSFLKFSGNWEKVTIQIDEAQPFSLEGTKEKSRREGEETFNGKLYQISPGKHSIKVYRNSNLLINRVLFLENQTTMEVIIP